MTSRSGIFTLIFLIVLLIPRFARIVSPYIWLESEYYLNSAYLLSQGFRPYVDFAHAHFPLPENILATLFLIFGPSLRVVEFFTQILVFISSLVIFQIGKLMKNSIAGVISALIFANSYVIFRYHVFEREIFVATLMLLSVYMLFRSKQFSAKLPLLLAMLVVVGLLCKLSAIAYLPAITIYLYFHSGRKSALQFILFTILLFGLVTTGFYLVYGSHFLIQVFLFRILHGFTAFAQKWSLFKEVLDLNLILGIPGIVIMLKERSKESLMILAFIILSFVFVFLLNHTFWPHNGIEILPWLSIAAGMFLEEIISFFRTTKLKMKPAFPLIVYVALAFSLWLFVFPVRFSDWGFGFRERQELDRVASYIRSQTHEDDVIFTPPIFAFLSGRVEIVPYTEMAGTMIELESKVRKKGMIQTIRSTRRMRFEDAMLNSQRIWLPEVFEKIHHRRLKVVINPSPFDRGYLKDLVPEDFLKANKYRISMMTDHYKVWTPLR